MNKKCLVYTAIGMVVIGTIGAGDAAAFSWKSLFGGLFGGDETSSTENAKEEGKAEESEGVPAADNKDSSKSEKSEKKESPSKKKSKVEPVKEKSAAEKDKKEDSDKAKNEDLVVKFKDGSSINSKEVSTEMNKIPAHLTSKMSFSDLKSFISIKMAFSHIVTDEAKKKGLDKDPALQTDIKNKQNTIAGVMFLNKQAEKLMTDEALHAHYDKVWDANFKGSKEYSIKVITTTDKGMSEKFKKTVKNQESLNKLIKANQAHIKTMDLDNRTESSLPVEIVDQVKSQGANAFIGPILVKDTYMMFFVKSVRDAKKHEFTAKFKEDYKKIAMKDFTDKVNESMYAKNKVKIFDLDSKEVDLKKVGETVRERAKGNTPPPDQFKLKGIKDSFVLAKIGDEEVVVSDVKKFFKIQSFEDEAFIMMAQQFKMPLTEVLIYATKLLVDDKLLARAAKNAKFTEDEEVKTRCEEIARGEMERAYLQKCAGDITVEDTKKAFNEFIKSIPEEDKNEHEISVRLLMFKNKEDAAKALASMKSGAEKFNDVYKNTRETEDKTALDLGYINKRAVDPSFWSIIKKAASGACYKDVIEIDGEKFGKDGFDYAVAYVGSKRPIPLPSLSNPQEKKYFEEFAKRQKKQAFVKTLFLSNVSSIQGKDIGEFLEDESSARMVEALATGG